MICCRTMSGEDLAATTLAQRLEAGPLSPEVVARLGVHACRALTSTPRAPGGRRDVGPADVLLSTMETGEVAVRIEAPRGPARSPMYRSPEQATHASPPDAHEGGWAGPFSASSVGAFAA